MLILMFKYIKKHKSIDMYPHSQSAVPILLLYMKTELVTICNCQLHQNRSTFLSSNIHLVTPKHLTMVYSTDSNNFLTALFVDIIQTTINLKPSLVCLFVCKTVCHMCSAAAIFNAAVRLQTAVQHCRLIVWDFICFRIYT